MAKLADYKGESPSARVKKEWKTKVGSTRDNPVAVLEVTKGLETNFGSKRVRGGGSE